ncbi:MAG: dTMP kinase [Aquificae bacterium]|nr:dTMP kinase [Aquificota bacterium]
MKGLFVTFEGIEGAGKSTQAKELYNYLKEQNPKVALTREPGGTDTGKKIREILLTPTEEVFPSLAELFLYEADRVLHVENKIKPLLEKGYIVISDRYIDSTLAYQGYARNIDKEVVKYLNKLATDNLTPDITFLIDIPVEEGLKRIREERGFDRIEQEDIDFHKKLREGFLKIAQEEKNRVVVIDGLNSPQEISAKIIKIFESRFKEYL